MSAFIKSFTANELIDNSEILSVRKFSFYPFSTYSLPGINFVSISLFLIVQKLMSLAILT